MTTLNLKKDVRWLGPRDEFGHEWAQQDGKLFAWSDSNTRYEDAWWLNDDGTPAKGQTMNQQNHINRICADRPFDPEWLS